MAVLQTYICDICGTAKREANHWFRAASIPGRFTVILWNDDTFESLKNLSASAELHLCGLQCATKAMHKAMEE